MPTRRAAIVLVLLAAAMIGPAPHAAAQTARKPAGPTLIEDRERGFAVELPAGWYPIEQDTGQGDREPVLRAAKDDQFLAVLIEKGPTDDAADGGADARANFESGFKKAPGYARLSIKSLVLPPSPGGKPSLPTIDLWFRMERAGKPVVIGVRGIFYKGYVLTMIVDCPGKKADAATKRLLASLVPIKSAPAAKPAPTTPAPRTPAPPTPAPASPKP